MATLNDAVKQFIVQALACYDTPTQVSEAVKEEFGLDVPRQQVALYDPTKASGKTVAKKWRDLFDDIRTKNKRVSYVFAGLRHNVDSIKSKARILIAWVDEAENVSEVAWQKLAPTVREAGSEIWITWNPKKDGSPTDKRYRKSPPTGAKIVELNYTDNPWFPAELEQERLDDRERLDDQTYAWIWDGAYRENSKAQILAGKYRVQEFDFADAFDGPYYGLDWGFSQDPTAGVRVGIHDQRLYIEHEAGKVGLENDDIAKFMIDRLPGIERHVVRADSARPETISHVKSNGDGKRLCLPRIVGVPSPQPGDYADVDQGAGHDVARYIWDDSDEEWVKQAGEVAPLTASQVKALYESNADTNAYTNAERSKLAGVSANATANTGTVTSVQVAVPAGLQVSGGPVTGAGTLTISYQTGYSIPANAQQSEWDAAYGWGNHAAAGYALASAVTSALAGKVDTSDARLTNAREWTASTVTQATAEGGTSTARFAWTAQRVRQAISAWWATITLTKADVGLASVDNTADNQKTVKAFVISDTRAVVSVPNAVPARTGLFEFKQTSSVGSPPEPSTANYAHVLTINGWTADGISFGNGAVTGGASARRVAKVRNEEAPCNVPVRWRRGGRRG